MRSIILRILESSIPLICSCRYYGSYSINIAFHAFKGSWPEVVSKRFLICIELKYSSLSWLNLTPDFPTFSRSNYKKMRRKKNTMLNRSFIVRTSCLEKTPGFSTTSSALWGGFQPRRASPFTMASGRKPLSL